MLCLREFGRSATRLFLWFSRVGPLLATTLNQMIKSIDLPSLSVVFTVFSFFIKDAKVVFVGLCLYLLSAYVSWFWLVSLYISVFSTNWNHSVKQDLLCGLMSRIGVSCGISFIPPLHRGCDLCACLVWPCTKLTRSPLKAERRPNCCLGRSRVAHRTFRHRHGRHGRREVLSMFKTVAQRSPRRSVAHRSLKGGRMEAHTSPWSQNGCTVVGHWPPTKKCEHCVSIWATRVCLPCTTIVPPLADEWRSLSDHCGDHCAAIQRPRQHLSHHGNGSAFALPSLCDLLCHYRALVVQGRHKGRAAAVTQKHNFLGSGDHWAS